MTKNSKSGEKYLDLTPLQRTGIGTLAGAVTFWVGYSTGTPLLLNGIFAWIAFATSFMVFSWMIIINRSVDQIKEKAKKDDGGVVFVFIFIIISSIASMVAVLALSTSKDQAVQNHFLLLPASVVALILAWFIIHSQYIFHYAHEYYDDDEGEEEQERGLDFPNEEEPDYLDFAYFSFCMGCTFQVSDVDVTSKLIRKIVMVHGLLAFFINTFVVALTINMVAGLNQ